ncbi:MAG: SLC13 family permease [Planctomycetota bacterium]
MSAEAIQLLILLLAAVFLFISQMVRIEITSIALIVALPLLGILDSNEALSGFSNPATLTVASMLMMSAAMERAGLVDYAARLLSRYCRSGLGSVLLVLAVPTIGFSAFMNNTPVVALMIPVALTLARRAKQSPSRLLLPISYFAILGGTCTLFGTSTNILVDAFYRQSGGNGFGVFEFMPLGLIFVAAGLAYVLLAASRLLPDRTALADLLAIQAPGNFVTEVLLKPGSRYIGQTLEKVFPADREVKILQLVRGESAMLKPKPELELREGDTLYVESTARNLRHIFQDSDLEQGTAVADEERVPIFSLLSGEFPVDPVALGLQEAVPAERVNPVDLRIAEAVITPNSRFIGRRVRNLGLNRKYGVQVLAVRRQGKQHQYQLRDLQPAPGDVLLVQGEPTALRMIHEEGDFLLIEGVEKTLTFPERAPVALSILLGVILLASFSVAPIVFLALAGVAAMWATRCLDVRSAMRAVDPSVLLLLAGTIPLGLAMQKVGLAASAAEHLVHWVDTSRPWLLIGALYLATSLCTELLSNNATAVLLAPVALGLSTQLGIDARPLLIAITFGASASFSSPIGYQTNTLVMGPGGYRFADYLKFGLPLNLIMAALAAWWIPILWPLTASAN